MKRLIMIMLMMTVVGLTALMAQTHDIKGVVTDKKHDPVVGALVRVEGTDISTVTDIDGKFLLLDVPVEAEKVIVESIGMEATEAKIGTPIKLANRPKRLSLVVEAAVFGSQYTDNGSDVKTGYAVGVGFEVRMSRHWAFRPVLQLANRGVEFTASNDYVSYKETWNPLMLDLPMQFLLRYKLARKMNLVFSIGPMISWGISGKVKVSETGKEDVEYDIYKKQYANASDDKHPLLHPFSFGVSYGVGVEYKKLLIGVSGKNVMMWKDTRGIELLDNNFVLGGSVSYRF